MYYTDGIKVWLAVFSLLTNNVPCDVTLELAAATTDCLI